MSQEKKIIWQEVSPKYFSNFLQPLTVALVSVVFISLILVMGIMDLGRLDKTLAGFMENRGLDIITSIENVAQENLNYLYQALKEDQKGSEFAPLTNKAFSPQESLIEELVQLAREIDIKWRTEDLTEQKLRKIAERENLWLIALLNEKGKIVFQSRDMMQDIPQQPSPSTGRHEEIIIDLFNRFGKLDEIGYVAVRRKDGSGTILIALDNNGLRYWSTRIAVKKAIEEVGWGPGLTYIMVMDEYGKILSQAGKIPEGLKEADSIARNVLAGKVNMASRKTSSQEHRLFEIVAPVHLGDKVIGFARLALDRRRGDETLKENRNRMVMSMILIMAIGILSMWVIYQNQKRNADRMEEMGKRLQQAERLSAIGKLAAGVAHEIRNPLNAISIASQRIQREYSPDEGKKKKAFYHITGIIREEIRRLNDIIEEFVTFARSRRLEMHDHSITDLMQKIVSLMEEEAEQKGIVIRTAWNDNNLMVSMDVDKLKQAFYNLFKNAMEAIPGKGLITVSIAQDGRDKVNVRISDTGSGIAPEQLDRVFNPEYTTKEKGLGLGLTLAYEIIRGHRGDIRVQSRSGVGTMFDVLLPLKKGEEKGLKDEEFTRPRC